MDIKMVAENFDISASTLRYYEEIGLIPPVRRNVSGYRDYSELDLEWVNFAKCMRENGISLSVLKNYADLAQQGSHTEEQRKQILIEQQTLLEKKMQTLQNTQNFLKNKIETYDSHAKLIRKTLIK